MFRFLIRSRSIFAGEIHGFQNTESSGNCRSTLSHSIGESESNARTIQLI